MWNKELTEDELINWMRLIRSEGIGDITFYSLLQVYKNFDNIFEQIPRLQQNTGKKMILATRSSVLNEIELTQKFGGNIIASCEKQYSQVLKQIKDAPPIITVMGNKELLNKDSIAIVGSRSASINSCIFTNKIARDLSQYGFNVISGLAEGIDTAAHKIIEENLDTTAVVATGVNVIYPRENTNLYKKIIKGGLLVTEMPFDTKPKPQFFSRRNRIISGLSLGVIVVEAGNKSGSLITANYAVSQGKEIFAVPGTPIDQRFSGTNNLLKKGAKLVESAEDVIEVLKKEKMNFDYKNLSETKKVYHKEENNNIYHNNEIDEVKNAILQKIDYVPIDIDILIKNLKVESNLVLVSIIELEIESKILRYDGNKISLLYSE
jgi:DNA processing protein